MGKNVGEFSPYCAHEVNARASSSIISDTVYIINPDKDETINSIVAAAAINTIEI